MGVIILFHTDLFNLMQLMCKYVLLILSNTKIQIILHSNIKKMYPTKNRNFSKIVPKIQTFIQIPKPLQRSKPKKQPQPQSQTHLQQKFHTNKSRNRKQQSSQARATIYSSPQRINNNNNITQFTDERQLYSLQLQTAVMTQPQTRIKVYDGQTGNKNQRNVESEQYGYGRFQRGILEKARDMAWIGNGSQKQKEEIKKAQRFLTQPQNQHPIQQNHINLTAQIRKLGRKTKRTQKSLIQTSRQPQNEPQILKQFQNYDKLHSDAQKRKNNITRMLTEVTQPNGDNQQYSSIALSQVKQNSCLSIVTSRQQYQCKKKYVRSSASLKQKNKPALTSRIINPQDSSHLVMQNQLLKLENQKLRKISDHRKNQISLLLQQILSLKSQVFEIFQQNQEKQQQQCRTMKKQNSQLSLLEGSMLYQIQKSLGIIFSQVQQKQSGQNEEIDKQKVRKLSKHSKDRKMIAKDIYNRLKNVITGELEQSYSLEL